MRGRISNLISNGRRIKGVKGVYTSMARVSYFGSRNADFRLRGSDSEMLIVASRSGCLQPCLQHCMASVFKNHLWRSCKDKKLLGVEPNLLSVMFTAFFAHLGSWIDSASATLGGTRCHWLQSYVCFTRAGPTEALFSGTRARAFSIGCSVDLGIVLALALVIDNTVTTRTIVANFPLWRIQTTRAAVDSVISQRPAYGAGAPARYLGCRPYILVKRRPY